MSRRVAPPVEAPAFASILTSQDTYLNSVTPLSVVGSGGGGGGGGANPSFSTISFPVSNQVTSGVIKYSGLLCFNDAGTPVGNDFILQTADPIGALPVSTNNILINSPAGDSASLLLGAGDNANTYIIASLGGNYDPSAALNLVATGVNISSLNVYSINGVPYTGGGGTVPANLNLSTLNVSSMIITSSITTTDLINVAVLNGRPEVGNGLDIISAGNLNLIPSVNPTYGIYASGAFLSTSFLNVSSVVTNEITAVSSLTIQPTVDINILASSGNAQLASVNLDTTIASGRITNIFSSREINIQSAVSTNMTAQITKMNSLQSTIMNSPQTYISSTNIYCDGGEAGGAFVSAKPYSIAFPQGSGIFSSLSAQPGAVGYAWPMFTLEQYQKISTVCGF